MGVTVGTAIAGRYLLLHQLVSGRSGALFVAINQGTRELSALKVIGIDGLPPETVDQVSSLLRRAVHKLADIRSPQIVSINDVGLDSGNQAAFVVMEYVPGWSLSYRLTQDGRFSLGRTLRIVKQVAAALDVLHSRDLAHGDLKPESILVSANDTVKLTDVGMYRAFDKLLASEDGPALPHYLAPECFEMLEKHRRGSRTDIYALGVIMFELLTRRQPFEANSAAELAARREKSEAPVVSLYLPDIPPAVDQLVATCLSRNPRKRHAMGRDVEAEIDRILEGQRGTTKETILQTPSDSVDPARPPTFPQVTLGSFPAAFVDTSGQAYPLRAGEDGSPKDVYVLGRVTPGNEEIDINLSIDRRVSRQHARIFHRQGTWSMRDVSGRNRTWVNGQVIPTDRERRLKDGYTCQFGKTHLLFRISQ